jgi:hypothetical protein
MTRLDINRAMTRKCGVVYSIMGATLNNDVDVGRGRFARRSSASAPPRA